MTQTLLAPALVAQHTALDDADWPADVPMPPTDLPYDDGDKMESPWHFKLAALLMACYIAARGRRADYFVGANMFVYYSAQQVRNKDYRGPDVFLVKNVDGNRDRLSWIVWEEGGRTPDVIFELLSPSTEATDLGFKKQLYEEIFRTREYFCVAPNVTRLLGWRLGFHGYVPIEPDARGWLWSEEMQLWLGPWKGEYLRSSYTWLRMYHPSGELVLLPDEAERAQAEAERARAEAADERAETERAQAEAERARAQAADERAEAERAQAEAERARAEAADERAETERAQAEAERARAEAERARADNLAVRLATLEEQLRRLRGEEPSNE